MKLTPWFPADVKPVRKGLYIARVSKSNTSTKWLWNGHQWCNDITTGGTNWACFEQHREWRGLASDPAVPK